MFWLFSDSDAEDEDDIDGIEAGSDSDAAWDEVCDQEDMQQDIEENGRSDLDDDDASICN